MIMPRTLLCAAILLTIAVASVSAEVATPLSLPATPGPEACQGAERLTSEELRRLAATPTAGEPEAPVAYRSAPSPPTGTPADAATTAAVTATIREYYACANAGDWAAVFALLADDTIRHEFVDLARSAGVDPTTTDYPLFTRTPVPLSHAMSTGSVDIRDVTVRPDGQVVAVVENTLSSEGEPQYLQVVLVKEGGRWRLVSPTFLLAAGNRLPARGTPVP
jgi:hypothetical protein